MNPFDAVMDFEQALCEYTGAPYAVAVDSCTNALSLCLFKEFIDNGSQTILLPKRTYVGVAQAVINAGHKIRWIDLDWEERGAYTLAGTDIIDSARLLTYKMYEPGYDICLSFHWGKHLPIGRGGAILTDDLERARAYTQMRYDGRTPGVRPKDDTFTRGFHCFITPSDAAQGLMLMQQHLQKDNLPLPWDGYGDLSKQEIFK